MILKGRKKEKKTIINRVPNTTYEVLKKSHDVTSNQFSQNSQNSNMYSLVFP